MSPPRAGARDTGPYAHAARARHHGAGEMSGPDVESPAKEGGKRPGQGGRSADRFSLARSTARRSPRSAALPGAGSGGPRRAVSSNCSVCFEAGGPSPRPYGKARPAYFSRQPGEVAPSRWARRTQTSAPYQGAAAHPTGFFTLGATSARQNWGGVACGRIRPRRAEEETRDSPRKPPCGTRNPPAELYSR